MQALQASRPGSPADVVNAINLQNLILPSGTAKFGDTEYTVKMNGSPDAIAGLNDLPVKTVNGTTTYVRDVAYVRDGFSPQTNIVRKDGARGVLLSVLKNGGASTLDIVANLKRAAAARPGDPAGRHQDHAAVRPVGVRQGGGQGGRRRGADRRRPDGVDGAALPRQLALDADHRADDSALDPGLDPGAADARRDAQPDDARRPRPLGRHPGRPGDRDDREHRAPPAPRQAARRRDPRRRRRDRRAGVRLDARRLHRLRADVLPLRRRPLPVRAAGRGGRVRDAGLVLPVANARADAGDAADARRAQAAPAAARPSLLQRTYRAFDRQFERVRAAYTIALAGAARKARRLRRRLPRLLRPVVRPLPVPRARLLPERRCRADPPAHARADRYAHRGDGAAGRRRRSGDPRDRAEGPARDHPRQPRRAEQRHQPFVQQRRHDRHARRRDPALAEGRPPADRGVRDRCCAPSCRSAFPASSSSSSRPTSSRRSSTSACPRRSTCSSPATTWPATPRSPPAW